MSSAVKMPVLSRAFLAVAGAFALSVTLFLVAPAPADAVPGSTYSAAQCDANGRKFAGSLWGKSVTWQSFKCAKSANGQYRLNIYGVNAKEHFRGATYSSENACKTSGRKWKGTYQGSKVRWQYYSCTHVGSGRHRLNINLLS